MWNNFIIFQELVRVMNNCYCFSEDVYSLWKMVSAKLESKVIYTRLKVGWSSSNSQHVQLIGLMAYLNLLCEMIIIFVV